MAKTFFQRRTLIIALTTLVLLELCLNLWLRFMANDAFFENFATFEDYVERHPLRFTIHPYLNYINTPNYRLGERTHDEMGYRGPRHELDKPKGAFRIVAVGGSTTYTEYVENDADTYPARLEKELRERGFANVEVINAGVPGYTSWESLISLEFRVLDLEPDLVIVYDALNDAHTRLVKPSRYLGDNSGYRKCLSYPQTPWYEKIAVVRVALRLTGLSKQKKDLYSLTVRRGGCMLSKKCSTPKNELLEKNKPKFFRRNLENMIAVARANEVKIMFATYAYSKKKRDYVAKKVYQQALDENNAVILGLGRARGVFIFDFAAAMPSECDDCWRPRDGRHVSPKGAALQAKLFADFIEREGVLSPVSAVDGGLEESVSSPSEDKTSLVPSAASL